MHFVSFFLSMREISVIRAACVCVSVCIETNTTCEHSVHWLCWCVCVRVRLNAASIIRMWIICSHTLKCAFFSCVMKNSPHLTTQTYYLGKIDERFVSVALPRQPRFDWSNERICRVCCIWRRQWSRSSFVVVAMISYRFLPIAAMWVRDTTVYDDNGDEGSCDECETR